MVGGMVRSMRGLCIVPACRTCRRFVRQESFLQTVSIHHGYSIRHNLGRILSPCPLNVGVQEFLAELRQTTLRGRKGAREGKKQRLA